jgi:hypothetical protein
MIKTAYYHEKISIFLAANQDQILGELTNKHHFALDPTQKNAWVGQIANLKEQLRDFSQDDLFLEFAIPRMGKRVDAILLVKGVVYAVEYKVPRKHMRDMLWTKQRTMRLTLRISTRVVIIFT